MMDSFNKLMNKSAFLNKVVEENVGSAKFETMLLSMARENYGTSRKLAKIFLKAFGASQQMSLYLKALKRYLLIKDSLQMKRLEWVFGVAAIKTDNKFRETKYTYGVENIMRINDQAYTYTSTLCSSFNNSGANGVICLLERLLSQRGRADDFVLKAIKDLISLCIKDEVIAKFIYNMPPPSYQMARYTDWFWDYIETQRQEHEKYDQYSTLSSQSYLQTRINMTKKCLAKWEEFSNGYIKTCREEEDRQIALMQADPAFAESHIGQNWLINNPEVIRHWPPIYIVGKQVNTEKALIVAFEDEFCKVELLEIDCEYNYSNPTSMFNLSLPDKMIRTKSFTFKSYVQCK